MIFLLSLLTIFPKLDYSVVIPEEDSRSRWAGRRNWHQI